LRLLRPERSGGDAQQHGEAAHQWSSGQSVNALVIMSQ